MKSVLARFPNNNAAYSYIVPEGDDPQVGDLIVTSCNLPTLDTQGPLVWIGPHLGDAKIATVVEVMEGRHEKATKIYLQLVSARDVQEKQKRNRELVEKAKARDAARKRLREMMTEQGELELFRRLADTNPEAAKLLKILAD